jgi:hypothetical protein
MEGNLNVCVKEYKNNMSISLNNFMPILELIDTSCKQSNYIDCNVHIFNIQNMNTYNLIACSVNAVINQFE